MSARSCLLSASLALAAFGLIAAPALAAQDDIVEKTTVSFTKLTPANQKLVTTATAVVIAGIADARKAMDGSDLGKARWEIAQTRQLVKALRNASPAARLSDSIDDVKAAAKAGKPVSYTAVYQELDTYKSIASVEDVNFKLEKAKKASAAGKMDETVTALADVQASITYVEIDYPLKRVYGELTQAMVALDQKDVLTATDFVSQAEKDMQPVVKLTSAKIDEVVGAEDVEAIKLQKK
jgi:hypothetical protein